MSRPRHNAKPDFDITGDPGHVVTGAVSAQSPEQAQAPTPRLHEHPPTDHRTRPTREVIDRHLWQSRHGSVDADLAENYDPDLVLVTRWGSDRGHDGIRRLADKLRSDLPGMQFSYHELLVDGEIGFVEWRASADDGPHVGDGADTYVVRDGRIVAQTTHYLVHRPPAGNKP